MKVYVVTSGEYSDCHIEGVFLKKEDAEAYVEKRNWNLDENHCAYSRIEEYEWWKNKHYPLGMLMIREDGLYF